MKKIEWLAINEHVLNATNEPMPAKKYIPEWYKKISKFENSKKLKISHYETNNPKLNITVKSCMPFLDALATGYIQETWCDIYVEKDKYNKPMCHWSMGPPIMFARDKVASDNLLDKNIYYDMEFIWKIIWMPKLPKGYSMIFTHPFNRIDLPFFSLTGIIDNDVYYEKVESGGNFPFYIKKDFEGLIPAGTPMYQMIPIKRDNWGKNNKKVNNYTQNSVRKYFYDGYKKLHWKSKKYDY